MSNAAQRQLEIKLKEANRKIGQQATEILSLQTELRQLKSRSEYRQKFMAAGVTSAEDDYVKLQEENSWLREEIQRLLSGVAELQKLAPLRPNDMPVPPEAQDADIFQINIEYDHGGFTSLPADKICFVSFSIMIKHGNRWEKTTIIKDHDVANIYPGTKDDLIKEINHRVVPILHRAPTTDEIPQWELFEGVPRDTLVQAIQELAIVRYVPNVYYGYQDNEWNVFDLHIKPHMSFPDYRAEDLAKNKFTQLVHKSFENMEKRRDIPASMPQLPIKTGRPAGRKNREKKLT